MKIYDLITLIRKDADAAEIAANAGRQEDAKNILRKTGNRILNGLPYTGVNKSDASESDYE